MEENGLSIEIQEAAKAATSRLLPAKSKEKYEKEYNVFIEWCKSKKTTQYTEDVCLAYFFEKSNNGIDISKYLKLQAYLKRQCDTYKPKKSKVFSKSEIDKFITEAPDDTYLMIKVNYFVAFIFQ
jgi:hypothetical protein